MGLIIAGSTALVIGITLTAISAAGNHWILLTYSVPMTAPGIFAMSLGGRRIGEDAKMTNPMRTQALKQMEKEYRKLYESMETIVDEDTERMARDVIAQNPVLLSTIGIGVEDVKAILDKILDKIKKEMPR